MGFKLSLITSVLQIGIEAPDSTILDILKKGSYNKRQIYLRGPIKSRIMKINIYISVKIYT